MNNSEFNNKHPEQEAKKQLELYKHKISRVTIAYDLPGHYHQYVLILFDNEGRPMKSESEDKEIADVFRSFSVLLEGELDKTNGKLQFDQRTGRFEIDGDKNDELLLSCLRKILGNDTKTQVVN